MGRYISFLVDRTSYSLEKIVNLVMANQQEKEAFIQSVAHEYIEPVAHEYIEPVAHEYIEQGIQTRKLEIAKTMLLKLRWDIHTVEQATGLTQNELQALLKLGHTL